MGKVQSTSILSSFPKRSIDPLEPSVLEQFSLGFEFNKTLQEVRREVRLRTLKK